VTGLLAATLIVKDEGAVLDACLASLHGVVDEIVVVDTGSSDDSVEIARRHGARVSLFPWTGDFAAARNTALELATCEWILYIDADERLAPVSRAEVERLLQTAQDVAFRILLRPHSTSTPYREYRLWRHDPRIRFEGVIHEKVVPAIHRVAEEEGRGIGIADLLLEHVGYEGDQTRKHLRNLPLLRRQLADEPNNLFNLHHLARVLEGLGEQKEAEQVLEHAVEVARLQPTHGPGSLAFTELIRLRHLRGEDVEPLVAEARRRYPDNQLVVFLEGRYLLDSGRHEEALARFDFLLSIDASRLADVDGGPAYDTSIFGALSYEARGACLMALGRYAEAAETYAEASRTVPADPAFAAKRALALARAARAAAGGVSAEL
jgi:tetratricopeptide (TPR) repeat protein